MVVACLWCSDPAAQEAPKSARELFEAGQAAYEQGDLSNAVKYFEQSIEADPDSAPAYSGLGQVTLTNNGPLKDIIWLFEQAAELEPQNPEHFANMCRAYFQHQEHAKAEAACLKALELAPDSGSTQLTLAWIYLLGKAEPAKAVPYFKQVLDKVQNPKVYLGLGMAYARNNDMGHVLEIVTKLRSMGEETLASQLEKMVRPQGEAVASPVPMIDVGPSKVVSAVPPGPEPVTLPPDIGTHKIQLRGRLIIPPTVQDPAVEASPEPQEDGYRELTIQERMDKVRKLRGGTRSGRATGTVSMEGISGTGTVQIIPPPQ